MNYKARISPEFLRSLACPKCHSALAQNKSELICIKCKSRYPIIDGIPDLMPKELPDDVILSERKWSKKYKEAEKNIEKIIAEDAFYINDTISLFSKLWPNITNRTYLELGCGTFPLGRVFAKKGATVIGIDFSMPALRIAQSLAKRDGVRVFLVRGDIRHLPFASNQIGYVYGGGVLEHFKDVGGAVRELNRVMKVGGKAVNTVPYISLGTLTYRQLWGNIPNIPVLKQLAELIHIRILGGRHMIFGYELSFTAGQMRRLFQKAGFRILSIGPLPHKIMLERVKSVRLRILFQRLARTRLFWPMILVHAQKEKND